MAIGDLVKKARDMLHGSQDTATAALGTVAGAVKRRTGSTRDRHADPADAGAVPAEGAVPERGVVPADGEARQPRPSYPVGGTFAPASRASRPGHAPGTGTTGRTGATGTAGTRGTTGTPGTSGSEATP